MNPETDGYMEEVIDRCTEQPLVCGSSYRRHIHHLICRLVVPLLGHDQSRADHVRGQHATDDVLGHNDHHEDRLGAFPTYTEHEDVSKISLVPEKRTYCICGLLDELGYRSYPGPG